MKRRFTKILGVGLTLALLISLLLVAAPVSADVSKPTVDVDETDISFDGAVYTISFRINTDLVEADDPTITVRFPEDTDVAAVDTSDVGIEVTSGIGSDSGTVAGLTVTIDPDDPIVEIELDDLQNMQTSEPFKIGAMAYVQIKIADVTNPTDPGTYTLEVKTSAEDTYVESESYDIDVPAIAGGIYVRNASGILVNFETNLYEAVESVTATDFTITVGLGTYEISGTLLLDFEGLTLESSAGAEDTIIDTGTANIIAISITADDVTVDGFTIKSETTIKVISIWGSDGAIVRNNVITVDGTEAVGITPENTATNVTISGNTLDNATIYLSTGSGSTVSGNSGGTINISTAFSDNEITGNTLTDIDSRGIVFNGEAGTHLDNLVEGNTLSRNIRYGIHVENFSSNEPTVTNLTITGNTITDNEEVGILIDSGVDWGDGNTIKFNTITGNTDYGIQNDSAVDVDATFNWWGTTVSDDIADMINDTGAGATTYEPFLTGTAEAAIVGGKAAANASSLDAKDEAGVKVSGIVEDATPWRVADVISAVKFTANPVDALADAIAFYDVYVVLETDFVTADVTAKVKFYDSAITTGSVAHFWTGDFWAECSDQEARDGIIYVTITDDTLPALDELEGTIFGVVAGEAVFGAPVLLAPEVGERDIPLTPTFAWGAVIGADDGYDFELADNALFEDPMVTLFGYPALYYVYMKDLDYSSVYHWRVRARSGLLASEWAGGAFFTMDEPVEPVEPVEPADVILEPADIILEQPDIVVTLPTVTPITPSWIYVIIGVGAVLVIALLVLIVRTRRVA